MMHAFIVDAMLGNLARTLRFFGYDTLYVGELEGEGGALPDGDIYRLALETGRLVLTKDDQFSARDPGRVVLVRGKTLREEVACLKERLGLELVFDQANSRCSKCNEILLPVSKAQVEGRVKDGTYRTIDRFWECPRCTKLFWRGAHFRDKDGLLSKYDGILDSDETG
ncbi:MAG: DUF5615 family PIN-like protein [Candidatus Lokiarchaeota archaeon]|nr:DUF5615 family PIN-like protein [Candidatus Lokiarchaeota archaeon]